MIALWGLLFSKCFLLEYCVRHYAIPIDSRLYIWSLSILMASVATGVYLKLDFKIDQIKELCIKTPPCAYLYIISTGLAFALLTVGLISSTHALGFTSIILSAASFSSKTKHCPIRSTGWLVCAGLIFISQAPIEHLIFGFACLLLITLSNLAAWLKERKTLNAIY